MKTHKPTTKKASAPETREDKYGYSSGCGMAVDYATCLPRAATTEGNAPRGNRRDELLDALGATNVDEALILIERNKAQRDKLLATVKMWEEKRDIWIDERKALNEEAYRHNGLRMSAIAQRDELLAACKRALSFLDAGQTLIKGKANNWTDQLRAAITKAEQP